METSRLFRKLAVQFPKSIKEKWDRIGLQTGVLPENINSVLLCLDFDEVVLKKIKAMKTKPDLIMTHHPFIFGTRMHVIKRNLIKKELVEEIDKLGVPVYSMHTNFDNGKGGMNDALAEALGLQNIKQLETCPMARGGKLPKAMEIHEFALYANKCLGIEYSHLIAAGKKQIKTVAIIGGGGSRDFRAALAEGYDIFISGDISHSTRREVVANHFNFLDVSHEVERIFMPTMKKILLEIDPKMKVEIFDHEEIPELIK